ERRAGHGRNRVLEIVVVPKIDEIAADLQLAALGYGDGFHQTEVPLLVRWPSQRVSSQIAATRHAVFEKRARRGAWCNQEARGIPGNEERTNSTTGLFLSGSGGIVVRFEDSVRIQVRPRGSCRSDARRVDSRSNGEWLTRLRLRPSRDFPAAKNMSQRLAGPTGREPRNFVNVVHN